MSTLLRRLSTLGSGLAVLLLAVGAAQADDRYVATTGSDSGSCTDSSSPCRTVNYCLSQMTAGDTCWVADGSYSDTGSSGSCIGSSSGTRVLLIENSSCTSASPCAIRAQNVSDPPTVKMAAGGTWGLCIKNSDHWTIEGVEFATTTYGSGVFNSDETVLRNLAFTSSASGKSTHNRYWDSNNLTIDNVNYNVSFDLCVTPNPGPRAVEFDNMNGVTMERSFLGHTNHLMNMDKGSKNLTFRRNTFGHFTEHGIVHHLDGDTTNVLIENNVFEGYRPCSSVCGTTSPGACSMTGPRTIDVYEVNGLTVRNNTFVGHGYMHQTILKNYGSTQCNDAGECDRKDIKLYNNLVYDIRPRGSGSNDNTIAFTGGGTATCSNVFFDGNLYNKDPGDFGCDTHKGDDFAAWSGGSCCGGSGNADPSGTDATPSFVDYAGGDYRAPDDQAAQINRGVNGTDADGVARCAAEDFDGNPRSDGQCDIGAFEFTGGGVNTSPGTVTGLARTDVAP